MLGLGSRRCVFARLGMHGALAIALLGCNKTDAGSGTLGSPDASAAGREAATPSSRIGDASTSGNTDALARSLVAVAATKPGEAQPCERTCGRVGDCLLDTGDVGEFEAGRLELMCLDMCVHSPESDGPRAAFLACEQQSGCGELLGCARSNWDALVATRSGPSVHGVTVGGDSCIESCQWWLACMLNGVPPDQAPIPPEYQESLRSCETQCETTPSDREMFTRLGDCMRANCSPERQPVCWEGF